MRLNTRIWGWCAMPRKTKYSPDVVNRIVQAIELGAYDKHAAAFGGISEDTFARWQERYADFADAIARARGTRVVKWLAKIEKAADEDWRAAQAKLQMCERDTYGKTVQENQITGKDGEPFVLRLEVVDK